MPVLSSNKFNATVIKNLGSYVYLYIDPIYNQIFYVGKGKGNRAFSHLEEKSEHDKVKRINDIRSQGREPVIEILIHGLDDKGARKVESSVIDLIGKDKLTNKVAGWNSGVYGRMKLDQIKSIYDAKDAKITEPGILIKINQSFRYGMLPIELYDVTRCCWKLGERRNKAKYVFAVYDGVIQEVYEILDWYMGGLTMASTGSKLEEDRWEFVGRIADDSIRNKYLNKKVNHKEQNPIKYVNID